MRIVDQPEVRAYHVFSHVLSYAGAMAECLNSRNDYVQMPHSDGDKEIV